MRTLQLVVALLAVASVACNRSDTRVDADRTAEQVKSAAVKAGHQLADSWLTTKIQAQYFADDDLKARYINVSTRGAVVTLTGFVEGQPQRELALQIARSTDGVKEVKDGLAIRGDAARSAQEPGAAATSGRPAGAPPSPTADPEDAGGAPAAGNDALVTARIQSKYFVDERVKGRRIDVDAKGGVVTLSGEVASDEERTQALLLARSTEGVTRVEDHLTVRPEAPPTPAATPVDDAMLTTTIQAKFFVDTTVKGSAIDVSSQNGVVTLQGTIADEAARKQAIAIAQNTTGVTQVVDRLRIQAVSGRR